jgi:HD-GYP domain-containing protein (c-di-GMP phosphodiesterase class II)
MTYVPIPLDKIDFGKPLPVNVWDPRGNLLLRKGQIADSQRHKEFLAAHEASATEYDLKAWQRGYERMLYTMLRDGVSLELIAKAKMPEVLLESDYTVGFEVQGGWLDLREALSSILYLGETARKPLDRLEGIQAKAKAMLKADPDECLFILFQALADTTLGYCATHALLSAVVCELTAQKLGVAEVVRPLLFRAALTMNIGMAQEQDLLARQMGAPSDTQMKLIAVHAQQSVSILGKMGINDEDVLDLVATHHDADESRGLRRNLECRRILTLADRFVARMAPRSTRLALSGLGAAKTMVTQATGEEARLGTAMVTAVGFYPPGTYVKLANGEWAVSVKRGPLANTPTVVSIVDNLGVAIGTYTTKDTRDPRFTIKSPVNFDKIKLKISAAKVLKAVARPSYPE